MLTDREIHIVDSQGASKAQAILARMAVAMAADGTAPAEIAEYLSRRASDLRMYVALETLEYLKRGGRISGARAAIGTLLSVKPIIAVEAGVVDTADRVADASKGARTADRDDHGAPDRTARDPPHGDARCRGLPRRGRGAGHGSLDPATVTIGLVGASVGPHLGPGLPGRSGPLRGRIARTFELRGRLQQGCRNVVTR